MRLAGLRQDEYSAAGRCIDPKVTRWEKSRQIATEFRVAGRFH
jgi:hypothetical protein